MHNLEICSFLMSVPIKELKVLVIAESDLGYADSLERFKLKVNITI
jgi:hypothetical protein